MSDDVDTEDTARYQGLEPRVTARGNINVKAGCQRANNYTPGTRTESCQRTADGVRDT